MVTIGINAHLLSGRGGYRRAGIHHYIAQVVAHLPADDAVGYRVFTRTRPGWDRPDLRIIPSRWPTERRLVRILWEQTAWPLAAARRDLDLLHSMAFVLPLWRPCPAVVTVYDLSFMHTPDAFPALQRLYLTTQTRRSVRQAQRVVTISRSGRDDVHRFFGVPLDRIDVVMPGVDARYAPRPGDEIAAFRHSHNLPDRFILHVGTLQPRKNIPTLLEAMARLDQTGVPLVLVGGKGWLYDEIFTRVEALGLEDRVRFAGYVPDDDLPLWYNAASLLVLPSLYEGFGLPAVEALACGTPVIGADTSAIPEAVGDAGLLFPPRDISSLANRIVRILADSELAVTMRERGFVHAERFSWARSGRALANTYRRALAQDQR